MTDRERLFTLIARRESARAASLGQAIAQVRAQQAEAEAMGSRLRRLTQDMAPATGPMLASQLRAAGMLAQELESEVDRISARADHAKTESARLRGMVILHERRRETAQSAAAAARAAEAEAVAARIDAQSPAPRRR
jgi:DNA repair exonuclease SbcCD ATPase subunit